MTRKLAYLLPMTLAAGAAPQIAQASCSGNACGALLAAATYSSMDKRVNGTVTNRDQAKTVQLKFCINVEGKCNSFEATLPPQKSVPKFVPFNGSAAPQKFGVDIVSAEFNALPANGADTPFGKFTYLTNAESDVLPKVKKAAADFYAAESLDRELDRQAIKLGGMSDRIGATNNVDSDVRNNNGKSEQAAIAAKTASQLLGVASALLTSMRNDAKDAAENLKWDSNELDALRKETRAADLMKKANEAASALNKIIGLASTAIDAGKAYGAAMTGDPIPAFKLSLQADSALINAIVGISPLVKEANELQAAAAELRQTAAEGRFKTAGDRLRSLQEAVGKLKPLVDDIQANHERAWKAAQNTFDKNTQGRFHFEWVEAAIPEVQKTIDLARKTTEAAYTAEKAAKDLGELPNSVMAHPAEDRKIISDMHNTATNYLNQAVAKRQSAEMLLKRLQEALATARKSI
jgi:hypothetical protein